MHTISKQLLVNAPQDIAFKVFTEHMNNWWPATHHIGKTPMVSIVVEPYKGGRWYSKHEDGAEVVIGYVDVWKPSDQLVLIWQVDGDFSCNPNLITEVDVRFIAVDENKTEIVFEHRGLEKMLKGAGKAIESMDQGWGLILNLYKSKAEK